jgi:hypothetical protein
MRIAGVTMSSKPEVQAAIAAGYMLIAIHDTLLEIRDALIKEEDN